MRHRVRLVCLLAIASASSAAAQAPRHLRPFLRLDAGALNPKDPTLLTLSVGASLGVQSGHHVWVFEALQQSNNGPSGASLITYGRTLLMLGWEHMGEGHGSLQRQLFVRAGGGIMLRKTFKDAPVVDLGFGMRYRMNRTISLQGTVRDVIAFIPRETFDNCPTFPGQCIVTVGGSPQNNWGFTMSLELHP